MKLIAVFLFTFFSLHPFGIVSAQKNNSVLNLQLKTALNTTYNFSSLSDSKATVFIFLLTDCPASQNYTLTINQLQKKYESKKIPFVVIFPDTYSTVEDIRSFLKSYKLSLPALLDPELTLTKLLNASIAPSCFVLDGNANVIYNGRIDDWYYSPGKKRTVIRTHDLDNALSNFINGKSIDPNQTKPIGCIINY